MNGELERLASFLKEHESCCVRVGASVHLASALIHFSNTIEVEANDSHDSD